ncbi:hypothetical protein [Helicobacter ailurogastricus]|uniref:hypothetical protein n=1 Tax=Helicobacter ailurogastricus TaxID=1578720 RepID=UPI0006B46A00|nr:hypothetical protein [Helicobacter ailurogastricus]
MVFGRGSSSKGKAGAGKKQKNCIKRERQAYLGFDGACLLDLAFWLGWAFWARDRQLITKVGTFKKLLIVLSCINSVV